MKLHGFDKSQTFNLIDSKTKNSQLFNHKTHTSSEIFSIPNLLETFFRKLYFHHELNHLKNKMYSTIYYVTSIKICTKRITLTPSNDLQLFQLKNFEKTINDSITDKD